jgi:hypothetical protein
MQRNAMQQRSSIAVQQYSIKQSTASSKTQSKEYLIHLTNQAKPKEGKKKKEKKVSSKSPGNVEIGKIRRKGKEKKNPPKKSGLAFLHSCIVHCAWLHGA